MRRRRKSRFWILVLLFFVFIAYKFGPKLFTKSSAIISPLADSETGSKLSNIVKLFQPKVKSKTPEQLLSEIKQFIAKQKGNYSVYIYELKTNQGYGINETTIYTAASVNKVPVLAALYYQVQAGVIDLDERITVQSADIQDFGTGILRNEGPGGVYSLKSLAQIMMEKSDNTAAFILTNKIGTDKIQQLINDWGLTQTDIINNKTSNKDLALIFTKMFQGKIANQALTQEMLGFMDDSDFENRLPKLLPKDVKVYHKIGNEIGNIHDIGIVAIPDHPYYIGVLTNDITDEPQAESAIAEISRTVYEFMRNK